MSVCTRRPITRLLIPLGTVAALVAGMLTFTATVTPVQDAAAATVTIGTIQAQLTNHQGVNTGTVGNCITYAPPGTATSSALVSSPNEAQTAHGRPSNNQNSCPSNLNENTQSAVGFRPSPTTSAQDGVAFPIGQMIHYNNPVYSSDRYFTGRINAVLGGFTTPNTLGFDWQLDETPNSGGGNCCNDLISFTNQISTVTLTQGGLSFRLVILGFIPVSPTTTCPTVPSGTPQNNFSTVEGAQTHACLYASLVQVRSLTIVKTVTGTAPPVRSFDFTSSSSLAGSPWSNGAFPLTSGGTETRSLTSGNTVTVTETDPGDDRWSLTGLACTEVNAGGAVVPATWVTTNLAARQVVLANVPPPLNAAQPGVTCTYTNTYTPKSTLTLLKQVNSGSAAPNLWTLTATGSAAAPPAGFTVSGPSGSAAVTAQRVPAGTYTLSELGTGNAATGYVQDGTWVCSTGGGATVPVSNSAVILPNSAVGAAAAVTCTVANRLAVGSLRISKIVDAPAGSYTGGTSKTFAGTYDCGVGATGTFSTLTTAAPVTIANIPAGRTCTVTETPPTGGLANASYSWGPATFSAQPVTITDGGTASIDITNPVVQNFGSFSMTKTVSGPGGFTGGTGRVFPVEYSCTLTNGPTTSGTVDLTTAQAVSPSTPIPTGSVCSFTETLIKQDRDFSDPSYDWSGYTLSPPTVTIGDNSTATIELTNNYARNFSTLTVTKSVQGDGYTGGTGNHFLIGYNCGGEFAGQFLLNDGGTNTVTGLPVGSVCGIEELDGGGDPNLWPSPSLLSPAYTWEAPAWSPGNVVVIAADGSAAATVTNTTVPIFGRVSVTKSVTGATQGVLAGTTFGITASCTPVGGAATSYSFDLAAGTTGTTPDLPVGTTCEFTETPPSGGLLDESYAWGPTPVIDAVTVQTSGQVVPVAVSNTVVRVSGALTIAKAPILPGGIVDDGRTFTIGYRCVYGSDDPVTGVVELTAGQTSAPVVVLLGSVCAVTEDPANFTAPPSADDPSWVWLGPSFEPGSQVQITSATGDPAVTVTNSIQQLTGSFNVSKTVVGSGKAGGYDGGTFGFVADCTNGETFTFELVDGQGFEAPVLPAFTECTVTELTRPDPTSSAYGWDDAQYYVNGVLTDPATFTIPESGDPIQVNAINPITPRLGPVTVTKQVTGETTGLIGTPDFEITLSCGAGGTYVLSVPADSSRTQDGIPIGSTCSASEAAPAGGLLDESYAWGAPSISADVVVTGDGDPVITVTNPIVRVTQPLTVVKTFSGPQGVVDPARTYPVHWTCSYAGSIYAEGDVDIVAAPSGVQVADSIPLTSECTATEADPGAPSDDPAYRWLDPVITGTVISAPGPGTNTVTVANSLTRDSGLVLVRKQVVGATEGYVNLGTGSEDFTLHGQCSVPGHPEIPTRTADGSIADGGEVPIVASIGWTCSGFEDSPGQNLLKDDSYAWAAPVLTPSGTFVLTRQAPEQIFLAQNPIVRVAGGLQITKTVNDPNGVVDQGVTFTGGYSCQYGTDDPITGTWSIAGAAGGTVLVDDTFFLGSVCTVTEDDQNAKAPNGLPDGSWTWDAPVIGDAVTVEAGGTATVQVTNSVSRLWAGLQVAKTVVAPEGGVRPDATFPGSFSCSLGDTTYGGRFTVGANATVTVFTPDDQFVPATATCSIAEDTLDDSGLVDGSFAWDQPSYDPVDVVLRTGETASLGVTNSVVRVYSDVAVTKVVTGPAAGQVDPTRIFSGTVSCQYGTDTPIQTPWEATVGESRLVAGVLVGSVCRVLDETSPGAVGRPVTDDPSFIWGEPDLGDPIVVTPPGQVTPPLVVTNPTARLFGSFTVAKAVTGAVDGLVDPTAPYPMSYVCVAGNGSTKSGELEVEPGVVRVVGPEVEIPVGSTCTLTEPLDTLPELRDAAWTWNDPTFTVDDEPAVPGEDPRSVTFVIPEVQEDLPEPVVEIGVTNEISKAPGQYSVAKSSDPISGSIVQPGSVITYTLTLDSTGDVPVHDVLVTDDLTAVLPFATVLDGSITVPDGTTAVVNTLGQQLIWTVGTVDAGTTLILTYQVTVNAGAAGVTIANSVTSTADVPPEQCGQAAPLTDLVAAAQVSPCGTEHPTTLAPIIHKEVLGPPVRDSGTGEWTVEYGIGVTNLNASAASPYTLTDALDFGPGIEVRSAGVTAAPEGVTLAEPAWNGVGDTTVTQDAELPAGAAHSYTLTVRAFAPPATPVSSLECVPAGDGGGSGLFNSGSVASLGSESTSAACAYLPVIVSADKQWLIDGTAYPDGSQPSGFSATLTLDGTPRVWRTEYNGFAPGAGVAVGEEVIVPADCVNDAVGLGSFVPATALSSVTVTNVVTCQQPPVPPNPPVPPTPVYPALPNTGFALEPVLGWGLALIAAGVLLMLGAGFRFGRRRAAGQV